jgi:two-component sensor histidine kinase
MGMRRNGVGIRALKVSAVVSTALIALSAAVFFFLEGRRASEAVNKEVSRLVDSQSPGIIEALWDYDGELLRALAKGLRNYPYINYVGIDGSGGMRMEEGARKAGSAELSLPLSRRARSGEAVPLGTLLVEIDRSRIGAELLRTILPSAMILLVSMAAMSLVFLLLFSRTTVRHLTEIARYLGAFDPKTAPSPAPLELDRKRRGDEFDLLADAFNSMSANLRSARRAESEAMDGLLRSLREKDVLLQEIYHRTRNNMQLISAFLSMEAGPDPDAGLSRLVARMDSRISSMALVHKKLYESKDLSRIDIGDYLEELAREIRLSSLAGRPGILIGVEAEKGVVALIDAAVPCGLAINELVSNAVEHAFPDGRDGRIAIELSRPRPGLLRLAVSDDGVGLPEPFDIARDGKTGLRIVSLLAESQLRGKLEILPGPGARFAISIRDDFFEPRV